MMKNLIIIPTLDRVDELERCLNSVKAKSTCSDVIVAVDYDQVKKFSMRSDVYWRVFREDEKRNCVNKINTVAMDNIDKYDFITFVGDDCIVTTEEWDRKLCSVIEKDFHGMGMVSPGEPEWGRQDDLPLHWMVSSNMIRAIGYFVNTIFNHNYVDNDLHQYAMSINSYRKVRDVIVEHHHPNHGKSEVDLTYVMGERTWKDIDEQTYNEYLVSEDRAERSKKLYQEKLNNDLKIHNCFDTIYCINLSRRLDRRQEMERKFKEVDMKVEFFEAIDGSAFPSFHKLQSDGYFGSLMSHLSAYKKSLDAGHDKIMVIEDDLKVNKDIHRAWFELTQHIPNDWGMIYFSYIPLSEDHQMWNYNLINDKFVSGGVCAGVFEAQNLFSLMGYCINGKMMETIIEVYKEIGPTEELDNMITSRLQKNDEYKIYAVSPQLFVGTDTMSDGTNTYLEVEQRSTDSRCLEHNTFI